MSSKYVKKTNIFISILLSILGIFLFYIFAGIAVLLLSLIIYIISLILDLDFLLRFFFYPFAEETLFNIVYILPFGLACNLLMLLYEKTVKNDQNKNLSFMITGGTLITTNVLFLIINAISGSSVIANIIIALAALYLLSEGKKEYKMYEPQEEIYCNNELQSSLNTNENDYSFSVKNESEYFIELKNIELCYDIVKRCESELPLEYISAKHVIVDQLYKNEKAIYGFILSETQMYLVILDICFDLISSGKFHKSLGELNEDSEAPALCLVFDTCIDWLKENGHLTEEEYHDISAELQENINFAG